MKGYDIQRVMVFAMALTLVAGCSSRGVYDSTQHRRQAECQQIVDTEEYYACMARASQTYDEYKRSVEPVLD
ncbi:hypothetical protein [Marinobacter fonticola]|uniref:hypothetical protein n=1 Tax=Marinobacter fonticola TaxID=2603215 RepID=UPI0011E6DF02|nr:hypothetical protein [Marinobacter fonticola]